jgi:hypothetical protein
MSTFVDYYALLGVAPDASADTIKAAFKKLALQYHPDVYKGADAHERMSALLQAYQTLSDSEARRDYDRRHAEHVLHRRSGQAGYAHASTQPTSSSARRDRSRIYDFPDMGEGAPALIDLHDIHYSLAPLEAERLRRQGMLRGSAPMTDDGSYYCHRCHHHWTVDAMRAEDAKTPRMPITCPKCHASDWSEYLLLRCVHCCAVFESEQIRYEVGTYVYGKGKGAVGTLCPPYELFPLCPYCATARWCPAEERRVMALRQQAEQRAAMVRMVWMSVLVVALVILGVVVFSMVH